MQIQDNLPSTIEPWTLVIVITRKGNLLAIEEHNPSKPQIHLNKQFMRKDTPNFEDSFHRNKLTEELSLALEGPMEGAVVTDRWWSVVAAVTDGEGSRRRPGGGGDLGLDRGGGLGIWEKIRYNVIPGSSCVPPVYRYLRKPETCIRPGSLQPDL